MFVYNTLTCIRHGWWYVVNHKFNEVSSISEYRPADELIVIWDQVVVNAFENKPFTNPPEDLLQKDFTRDIEKVEAFCRRASLLSEREANEEFQKILLANLIKSSVGLYSAMHERAIVMYSYNDPISIRLAYM